MASSHQDLLVMYRSEARDRLERIAGLLEDVQHDSEAAVRARRELHALKGASRMMGLAEIAELCHRAEGLMADPSPGAVRELIPLLDRLSALMEELPMGSEGELPTGPAESAPEVPTRGGQTAGEPVPAELRVRADVLDGLTDRGARLRVLSVAAGLLVKRLYRLARLADRSGREPSPRQALTTLAVALDQLAVELEAGQRRVQRLASGLLETLLHLQVQPLRPVLLTLARHARELARGLGKEVRVTVDAGETHLDRRIIEALREAFLHVVRNAVDHGIESPDERVAVGKPRRGSVQLRASAEGDRVRIAVADDGRGIDTEEVAATAVRRGHMGVEAAAVLSDEEVLNLLYLPGFSTREEASETSGRGIGLDAVAAAVREVGGDLRINSERGRGTTVLVEVPLARRGERALILQVGQALVAYPKSPVRSFRRLEPATVTDDGGRQFLMEGGDLIRLRSLADVLGLPESENGTVIVSVIGGVHLGLAVEAVVGEEEVFLRPMPPRAGAPRAFEGIALLANGRPVPVLSPQRLLAQDAVGDGPGAGLSWAGDLRVLVVDDSTTSRDMLQRVLGDAGVRVTAVSSAAEGLEFLDTHEVDCLVTDVEMPGMNGLELTRTIRADERWHDLPVVMVSTRDEAGDRQAGLEAGADAYLAKDGIDGAGLVTLIRELGGE